MHADPFAYYDSRAKLIGAAGVVLLDPSGSLLVVKPTYTDVWHLPGGIMEPGETPRAAARREVREEIGIDRPVGRLVSVDHKAANADRPAGIQFVFDGGTVTPDQIGSFVIDEAEIEAWRFVPFGVAVEMVQSGAPAARMAHTLAALTNGLTAYLENGEMA